jgi:hypothetical protein
VEEAWRFVEKVVEDCGECCGDLWRIGSDFVEDCEDKWKIVEDLLAAVI